MRLVYHSKESQSKIYLRTDTIKKVYLKCNTDENLNEKSPVDCLLLRVNEHVTEDSSLR